MPDEIALIRLMSWLSPAFPVGAYTYSHGLETAVEDGQITDRQSATLWISDIAAHGAGQADTIVLAHAWRAVIDQDDAALADVVTESAALSATSELALETESQGAAFVKAVAAAWPTEAMNRLQQAAVGPITYPVAVGVAAAGHGVALADTAIAYLHAFAANLISAIVRLVPLGQTDGLHITRSLEPLLPSIAASAIATPLDRLSVSTFIAEMKSMQHETQRTRLFRS